MIARSLYPASGRVERSEGRALPALFLVTLPQGAEQTPFQIAHLFGRESISTSYDPEAESDWLCGQPISVLCEEETSPQQALSI